MNFEKINNENLGRLNIKAFRDSEKIPVIIVLNNVRSAYNIGSIFRTSDAFRVKAIYLTGICAIPPHKEIMKTALGATDSVEWKYFKTAAESIMELKTKGFSIVGVEQTLNSTSLAEFHPPELLSLIFGNEINGIEPEILELCDEVVQIPQFGTKHSFNVAVIAGMILWDYFLKRSNKLKPEIKT